MLATTILDHRNEFIDHHSDIIQLAQEVCSHPVEESRHEDRLLLLQECSEEAPQSNLSSYLLKTQNQKEVVQNLQELVANLNILETDYLAVLIGHILLGVDDVSSLFFSDFSLNQLLSLLKHVLPILVTLSYIYSLVLLESVRKFLPSLPSVGGKGF